MVPSSSIMHEVNHIWQTCSDVVLTEDRPVHLYQVLVGLIQSDGIVNWVVGEEWGGGNAHGHPDPHPSQSLVCSELGVSKVGHPVEVVVHRMVDRVVEA